jgi:hypothetical protein
MRSAKWSEAEIDVLLYSVEMGGSLYTFALVVERDIFAAAERAEEYKSCVEG